MQPQLFSSKGRLGSAHVVLATKVVYPEDGSTHTFVSAITISENFGTNENCDNKMVFDLDKKDHLRASRARQEQIWWSQIW